HAQAMQKVAMTNTSDNSTDIKSTTLIQAHQEVIKAGEDVLSIIDATQVAANLGLQKPRDEDKVGLEARKKANEKKSALQEVYRASALSAFYLYRLMQHQAISPSSPEPPSELSTSVDNDSNRRTYEQNLVSLRQWDSLESDTNWWLWLQGKLDKAEYGDVVKKLLELKKKDSTQQSETDGQTSDPSALTQQNLRRELVACLAEDKLGWSHIVDRVRTLSLLNSFVDAPDC
ncbi:MAG: hypothetical protein VX964_03235, partial [Verrucomicrobiota bacterium]|nr:hypothetical protein [Verrucomicrobiota bacterium]